MQVRLPGSAHTYTHTVIRLMVFCQLFKSKSLVVLYELYVVFINYSCPNACATARLHTG